MASDLKSLLGLKPFSAELTAHISALATAASKPDVPAPEVKSYSDAVYFNYYPLGLSLLFKPVGGYKPKTGLKLEELQDNNLILDGIDIYNVPKPKAGANASRATKSPYTTYPISPITLSLVPLPADKEGKTRAESVSITPETTGKDFVLAMGEPDRKGGGAGPSSGSIGIWCEWSKDGVMVEFGGEESRGPQAWERGKDAVWKVISVFPAKTE
ncbi:hypothetical protein K466DRAFT_482224 [Polyporus arcularius HHB13444]|uniref:Uncharacterized protein n=1 Tax=Polyporus arcularius HHB13444 TaxID=1314778 RepID=A0A5C3PQ18_9APHY|nr:hypothetical protein K466DRAFT_482224 [Polyporus arcularius HHB13444]